MDEDKKQLIARASFLLILAALFIMMFVWATVLDFGYIKVEGEAPFKLNIWGQGEVMCDISPCKIKQSTGQKDIAFIKDEMQPISEQFELGRWETKKIVLDFKFTPELKEVIEVPEIEPEVEHEIVLDKGNKMYKLIEKEDPLKNAIVYFPKEIKDPQVFSSEDSALVLGEDSAYKVDFIKKERVQLNKKSFGKIVDGTWSPNGRYFVFEVSWSDKLLLLDGDKVRELDLYADSKHVWRYDNQLLFAVSQQYSDQEGSFKINLLDYTSSEGYTFGLYNPEEDGYMKIETFSEIEKLPLELIPVSNGRVIYIKSADRNYKLDYESF